MLPADLATASKDSEASMPKIAVLGFDPDLYDSGDLSAVLGKGKTLLNQKFKKEMSKMMMEIICFQT